LIEELWRARVEGRFGLKHWILAWLISLRAFACVWVFLNTAFGALLAGARDPAAILLTALIPTLAVTAAHFRNNYRDVEIGVDRYVDSPEEARRLISTIKPYTAAAWLVPLRITPVWFQKANELLFIALSLALYFAFAFNPYNLPFVALGLAMVLLYTDYFKPRKLGEIALFLGHGFGTVAFGYTTFSSDIAAAVLAGIPTGLISALVYGVDQMLDIKETDFIARARALYEVWFNARLPISLYVIASALAFYQLVIAWVAAGLYPRGVLLSLAALPIILYYASMMEWNKEVAVRSAVLTNVWLIPLLLNIGVLIS